MSYAVRYVLGLYKLRRGQRVPLVVRVCTHMDDFGLLGRRMADVASATRKLARWMERELRLALKPGRETRFLTISEEHIRRKAATPAGRGCPCLDMGGYRMHHSYTTVRRCIYLRAWRAYLRSGREAAGGGSIRLRRAYRLGAYFGYYKHTAAKGARRKLMVDKLTKLAGAVVSWNDKRRNLYAA